MKKWVVTAKRDDFKGIAQRFSIDQVTARLIRNRDIIGDEAIEEYLNGSLLNLHSPHLLSGCDRAVSILLDKIDEQKRIRIIGDYDIDGVTATYILKKGLERCGAVVDYEIPDRVKDGYGINETLVREAYEDGIDTILTCDNGISAIEQISLGKDLGMTMIVTDHHEIRTEAINGQKRELLPHADVIIDPHQQRCNYPYKNICGAVVAYKLIQNLYEAMHIPSYEIEQFIEFAAIATVGDVCDLTGENRILVREGLLSLNQTQNIGLKALIAVNGLLDKDINSYHIGFVIGPCINASGRLDTAKKALQLFLTESEAEATELAEELLILNNERKDMTLSGYEQAVELIEGSSLKNDKVLVVYLPDCHESLAGIIAGRIRERYYRPVFVLTKGEVDIKGSGRSIEQYSMFEEMQKCDGLFLKYGGHPMAAGCSLKEANINQLRTQLNLLTTLTDDDLIEKIRIDVPMPIDYIRKELIDELQLLEPFGKANEKPVFAAKNLSVLEARLIGKNRNICKLRICSEYGCVMDAIYFGDSDIFLTYLKQKFSAKDVENMFAGIQNRITLSVIYYPEINSYRGIDNIQIVIREYQ